MTTDRREVFERIRGYGFVHHRALNDPAKLKKALAVAEKYPDKTHILEGDICWDLTGSSPRYYFRHPDYIIDKLPLVRIEQGLGDGSLIGLDDLKTITMDNVLFLVELKVGRGPVNQALETLVDFLEGECPGRYWIDGFSLTMLDYVKSISPATTVTLHTELVLGGHVFVGAPEWPPLRIRRVESLTAIDGIAIRRHGPAGFMTRACASVKAAGKYLTVSRLSTLEHFRLSRLWGAVAGYMHWDMDELMQLDDRLAEKERAERPRGT